MAQESSPEYTTMIRDLPRGERPRERLRELGPGSLSNSELIAILLRTGLRGQSVLDLSGYLLARLGGLPGLARVSYGELCALKGVSDAKACQLLSGISSPMQRQTRRFTGRGAFPAPRASCPTGPIVMRCA